MLCVSPRRCIPSGWTPIHSASLFWRCNALPVAQISGIHSLINMHNPRPSPPPCLSVFLVLIFYVKFFVSFHSQTNASLLSGNHDAREGKCEYAIITPMHFKHSKHGTLLNNNTAIYLGIIILLYISFKLNISALLSHFIAMLVQDNCGWKCVVANALDIYWIDYIHCW